MVYMAVAKIQWTIVVFNSHNGYDTYSLSHLGKFATKKNSD